METCPVTCPTCFQVFEVPAPPIMETPCQVDYDCEVCCRPLLLNFEAAGDEVHAEATGIHD